MYENIMLGVLLGSYAAGLILWRMGRSREPANRVSWLWRFKRKIKCIITAEKKGIFLRWEAKFQKKKKRQMDKEIFNSSVMLKNLAIAEKGKAFSADYIYERLLENSKKLRPVYGQMLALYRSGKEQEGWKILVRQCGTRAARNFSMVLSKLDQIDPAELIEQMEVFQEAMAQEQASSEIKEIQKNSLLATGLALASAFALLVNFAAAIIYITMTKLVTTAFL